MSAHVNEEAAAELVRIARAQPGLFQLMYAFNYRPAEYLHPSRREGFAVPANDALWSDRRARNWLSEWILRRLGLLERPCFDLAAAVPAVALLDAARTQALARCVGAVVMREHVRRGLSREDVQRWKARITPEVYRFVMTSARLLPLPATPPANGEPAKDEPAHDELDVESIGFGWIDACFADAPEAISARARLKCPVEFEPAPRPGAVARQFVTSVLAAWEPQWCSSFAMAIS